jgi:hypothetical protein
MLKKYLILINIPKLFPYKKKSHFDESSPSMRKNVAEEELTFQNLSQFVT